MNDNQNMNLSDLLDDDTMEDLRVTLTLDNDEEAECQILTIFELGEQNYIVLMPEDTEEDEEEEKEVYIYS